MLGNEVPCHRVKTAREEAGSQKIDEGTNTKSLHQHNIEDKLCKDVEVVPGGKRLCAHERRS